MYGQNTEEHTEVNNVEPTVTELNWFKQALEPHSVEE